jgi:hypothetical protein
MALNPSNLRHKGLFVGYAMDGSKLNLNGMWDDQAIWIVTLFLYILILKIISLYS